MIPPDGINHIGWKLLYDDTDSPFRPITIGIGTRLYYSTKCGEFSTLVENPKIIASVLKINKKSIAIEVDGELVNRSLRNKFRIKK